MDKIKSWARRTIAYFKDWHHILELVLLVVGIVGLIVFDQVTKHAIYNKLFDELVAKGGKANSYTLIPGLIDYTMVYNQGAAWSSFSGAKALLSMISIIMAIVFIAVFIIFYTKMPRFVRIALVLAIAGDIGNMIDRVGYWANVSIFADKFNNSVTGGVIDFLEFHFWPQFGATFNIADVCIVSAAFTVVLGYIIFIVIASVIKRKKLEKQEIKDGENNAAQNKTASDDLLAKLEEKEKDASNENKGEKDE